MSSPVDLVERGWVPDALVRVGVRRLLRMRADHMRPADGPTRAERIEALIRQLCQGPIAEATDAANAQHYALPTAFFEQVLGPHMKYSCALWEEGAGDLEQAEARMLARSCERAGLADGQDILELGCGWGALSLWMAEHYPGARITAVSNSRPQGEFIEARAARRGLENLRVVTADINDFETEQRFDRVISLEMFEHMRNWGELFRRVSEWLRPGGQLFIHIFCHRDFPYFFEADDGSWMARHFFTGGLMPSDELPARFQEGLRLTRRWRVNGRHYGRTCGAWLQRLDAARDALLPVLRDTYGADRAMLWFRRWRIFFLASEEFFHWRRGEEWWVSHYLFQKPEA